MDRLDFFKKSSLGIAAIAAFPIIKPKIISRRKTIPPLKTVDMIAFRAGGQWHEHKLDNPINMINGDSLTVNYTLHCA